MWRANLPIVKVPERYKRGLQALAGLPEDAFAQLLAAIQGAPVLSTSKELATWIAPKLQEAKLVNSQTTQSIVEAISSLYRVRVRYELSPADLADDVLEAIRHSGETLDFDELKERLEKLLNQEALNTAQAKAMELRGEYERIFHDARIMTDLRPVFGGNVKDAPTAMIVVHTLKVSYYHDVRKRLHDFYISLDAADIASLKTLLERAESKEKSLKSKLESVGIRSLEML